MRFNRKKFFDGFHTRIDSTIEQEQVDGLEALLHGFENDPRWSDVRHIAYGLATAFHETAHSFQPVVEGYYLAKTNPPDYAGKTKRVKDFQKTLRYYPYFGRGYVQLTHKTNYARAGKAFGIDLVNNPELALTPEIAFKCLGGMFDGWYGGKLKTYINSQKTDYVNARRCVNVLDKAGLIAGYARSFERILKDSAVDSNSDNPPTPTVTELTNSLSHTPDNQPPTQVTTTKAVATDGEATSTEVVQRNEQDVNSTATVAVTQYQGVGLFGVLKKDFAAVGGGNLSFQTLQGYATEASGWPPWVISLIVKLATIAIILGVAWLIFRLAHYLAWRWHESHRQNKEAEIKSDTKRRDVEWA